MQSISILGSTGSIGLSTLDVISRHPDRYSVFALSGYSRYQVLAEQVLKFKPRYAVMVCEDAAGRLRDTLAASISQTEVLSGAKALESIASHDSVDCVVAAIVGAAGLEPSMAAVKASKKVLLANKEALVMSGALFMQAVEDSGAVLLPVDSEHNAIFQCLPDAVTSLAEAGIHKLLLTGSGGPFRICAIADLDSVTPEQAVAHPNWDMGKKISIDSATMMNKGLEFIEACWLFNAKPEDIEVVLHPQSIVHSMVQYRDGSVLAQLGQPDMRTPIAHCLAWPERIDAGVEPLDFTAISSLTFESPDYQRFPCLKLAMDAMKAGGDMPTALNAANEVAVDAFLAEQIAFTDIAKVVKNVVESWNLSEPLTIADVIEADRVARECASDAIQKLLQ
ncbi:MAG: 1-deoxy-D-xylulose-5-phosphate reductoisomerase [Flavobacteriales bacterium]